MRGRRGWRYYGLCPLLAAVAALGAALGEAQAYFFVAGSGATSVDVSSLSAPGGPQATLAASSVSVSWSASKIGGAVSASSYTVERYNEGGADLGEASCGAVPASAGAPDAFGDFSCTDSPTPGGTFKYKITARYRSWTASSSFTNSVLLKGSQTITFASLPAGRRFDEGPITVTAQASSGLPVSFESQTTDVCATSGGLGETVSFVTVGTCTIKASQAGDADWNAAAPVEQSFTITPTGTVLTSLSPASVSTGEGASRVAVSADGKNVYISNRGANTVSQYARDSETGKLTTLAQATVASGSEPEGVLVSPDGSSVYVANRISNTISQYERDGANGALTLQASLATGAGPIGLAISPDGKQLYTANGAAGTVSQFARNTETGALKALAKATVAAGANAHGIAVSGDGKNVYVANYSADTVSEYARDRVSGELTALGTVAAGINPHDLAISPDGESVYVANSVEAGDVLELARDRATGALTPQEAVAAGEFTECLVVSPDGSSVYATNEVTDNVSQYTRDTASGDLTALTPATVAAGLQPEGIAISADGRNVYTANSAAGSVSQYSR